MGAGMSVMEGFCQGGFADGSWEALEAYSGTTMDLNHWADDVWQESWVPESWGGAAEVGSGDGAVIRNFRKKRREYEWPTSPLRLGETWREEIVKDGVEIIQRIAHSADEKAELSARLLLEQAKEEYLETFEEAYRKAYREELLNQYMQDIATQRHLATMRRRAVMALLLAH